MRLQRVKLWVISWWKTWEPYRFQWKIARSFPFDDSLYLGWIIKSFNWRRAAWGFSAWLDLKIVTLVRNESDWVWYIIFFPFIYQTLRWLIVGWVYFRCLIWFIICWGSYHLSLCFLFTNFMSLGHELGFFYLSICFPSYFQYSLIFYYLLYLCSLCSSWFLQYTFSLFLTTFIDCFS